MEKMKALLRALVSLGLKSWNQEIQIQNQTEKSIKSWCLT